MNGTRLLLVTTFGLVTSLSAQARPGAADGGAERWTLVPDLEIGEPAAELTEVPHLTVDRDGAIYVLQPQEQAVRVFGGDGAPLATFGRRGRGPGEFQGPEFGGWLADTLVISDGVSLRRLTAFDRSGRAMYTVTPGGAEPLMPRALLAGGLMLAVPPWDSDAVALGTLSENPLLLVEREGSVVARMASLSFGVYVARVIIEVGGNRPPTESYFFHPFPTGDLYDVDPWGQGVIVVRQAHAGPSEPRFVVERFSASGNLEWSRSFRYQPERIPASLAADTIAAWVDKFAGHPVFGTLPRARLTSSVRRGIPIPSHFAPVGAVVAGRDGTTWLSRNHAEPIAIWMVLDETGTFIAEVRAPTDLRIHQADRDHVWGVRRDHLDVHRVVRFRVRRDGPG